MLGFLSRNIFEVCYIDREGVRAAFQTKHRRAANSYAQRRYEEGCGQVQIFRLSAKKAGAHPHSGEQAHSDQQLQADLQVGSDPQARSDQ